jgi:penicillin amidase
MPTNRLFYRIAIASALTLAAAIDTARGQSIDTLRAGGLRQPVEILRDRWGVSHIYATNEHDLFFAQGYVAASDRLFQLELWRRQATGTVAELLGPRAVERDISARLFKFRGDMSRELAHYHPHGAGIVGAFVEGINAYIAETERNPGLLPIEFRLLGTKPGRWTPAVVVSRHAGLLGNVEQELTYTRAVAAVGAMKMKELSNFHPGDPNLTIDPSIDTKLLDAPILARYQAFSSPIRFRPEDLAPNARGDVRNFDRLATAAESAFAFARERERLDIGSNNWVVSGRLTASGKPMLANDPHRNQSVPSLRYWTHLVAPGWNVIGGGEPSIPGVSIGHNEYGAWGLTIFATDGEDLYVYQTNPANPSQYKYRGAWESMRLIRDTIPVKGSSPSVVTLKYTRHGPVVYEDTAHHIAYAVRAAWLEPGSSPYLASLRMDQAKTWDEFREACSYSFIPGENMIWADRAGNIGWQAVGIAPIRTHWSGLVAIPGDGRYEWAGYLPINEKPHSFNPPEGFIGTANNDLIPRGYSHMNAVGFVWTDPFRWQRIAEVLGSGKKLTLEDMMRLQTDYLSIPARQLVPLLANVTAADPATESARRALLSWNFVLDKSSTVAGVYETWLNHLGDNVAQRVVPAGGRAYFRNLSTARVIEWLSTPPASFGANPRAVRDSILVQSLSQTVNDLTQRFGADTARWVYGQPTFHHALIRHPLSDVANPELKRTLDVGPAPRGGDSHTVGVTGAGGNQTSGASFRMVVDLADWDAAMGTNTPGQSGNPDSPHYRDLFELWSNDRYFAVPYSRSRVEAVTERRLVLSPRR